MPYREPTDLDDRLSRAAAETDFARRNMRACRNAFVTLTALASAWPYLHWQGLAILHTTFACVSAVCVFEEWRLGRMLRRQLKEAESSSPARPQS